MRKVLPQPGIRLRRVLPDVGEVTRVKRPTQPLRAAQQAIQSGNIAAGGVHIVEILHGHGYPVLHRNPTQHGELLAGTREEILPVVLRAEESRDRKDSPGAEFRRSLQMALHLLPGNLRQVVRQVVVPVHGGGGYSAAG